MAHVPDPLTHIRRRQLTFQHDLAVLGSPAVVALLVTQIQAWGAATLDFIHADRETLKAGFRSQSCQWTGQEPGDPVPAPTTTGAGWALLLGALAATALECLCAALLAALTFNLPRWLAVLTGIVLTLAITLVFKAAVRILLAGDPRPLHRVQTLSRHLRFVFPLWLVALAGVLLLGRVAESTAPVLALVFAGLMTVLTVASPWIAALLWVLAETHHWAAPFVQRWRQLDQLELDVRELLQHAHLVQYRPPAASAATAPTAPPALPAEAPAPAESGALAATRLAIATVALALLLPAPPAAAQATPAEYVWIDVRASASEPHHFIDPYATLKPRRRIRTAPAPQNARAVSAHDTRIVLPLRPLVGPRVPCAAPTLEFTAVPPAGSFENLEGCVRLCSGSAQDYRLLLYIKVLGGYWIKPYADKPFTPIREDSTFVIDTTTGGIDEAAREYHAFLVPAGFDDPPILLGAPSIPALLHRVALAEARVSRE